MFIYKNMCSLILAGIFFVTVNAQGYYEVIGPRAIRPNSEYHCAISIQATSIPTTVTTTLEGISFNGSSFSTSDTVVILPYSSGISTLEVPDIKPGNYKLEVRGQGGVSFAEDYPVEYLRKSYSVFIQTDRVIYRPESTIQFRAIILNSQLKPSSEVINELVLIQVSDGEGNKIKQWSNVKVPKGVFSGELKLSKRPVLGNWNISVTIRGQTFAKSIQVAEYVLPKFIIDIDTKRDITFRDGKIIANIETRYTNGKKVEGEATVTAYPTIFSGVIQPILQEPVRKVFPIFGSARVEFNIQDELRLNKEFERNVIFDVIIEEALTTRKQNNSVEIRIHKYDYNIYFVKSSDYFKPGLQYVAYAKITTHDGRPLSEDKNEVLVRHGYSRLNEVYTETRHKIDKNGIVKLEFSTPEKVTNTTALRIQVEYEDLKEKISPIPAAVSYSNVFVQATLETENPIVNTDVDISVLCTEPMKYLNYVLLGRGDVLIANSFQVYNRKEYQFRFTATHAMVPLSHMIISYVREDGELIADSLDIEVNGVLQNFIDIQLNTAESDPNLDLDLTIRAQPNSYIGLMAVDESNYFRKGFDVTQNQVSEDLQRYDMATMSPYFSIMKDSKWHFPWKPGMSNAHSLIYDSGADLLTNTRIFRHKPTLEDIYLRPVFYGSSTVKPDTGFGLALHHVTRPPLAGPYAFSRIPKPVSNRPRVFLSHDIQDTWLFLNFSSGYDGKTSVRRTIPNSLNNWVITGFSLDPLYGLGLVTSAKTLKVSKSFIVDVDLPYSIKRGETLALPVIVHNKGDKDINVEITLHNTEQKFEFTDLSNEVNGTKKTELYRRKKITVKKNSVGSASFLITPLEIGSIEIMANANAPRYQDIVKKYLNVIAEGETEYYSKAVVLDLRKTENFKTSLNFSIPKNAIANSEKIEVSAVANLLGPSVMNLHHLVRRPTGSGEANLIYMMPSLIILKYLKQTRDDNTKIQNEAIDLLETTYQEELSYKRKTGSFSVFGKNDPSSSVWLTAYAVFCLKQAEEFIYVEEKVVDDALFWLSSVQGRNGSFVEIGSIVHFDAQNNDNNSLALTAFVLMAFLENKTPSLDYSFTINRGLDYIARNIDENDSVYTIAVCSYVLQVAGHSSKRSLFNLLDAKAKTKDNDKWWSMDVPANEKNSPWNNLPKSIDIEATSYALLTFLEMKLLEDSIPVLNWLVKQENNMGGFTSSQDTAIGLFAFYKLISKLTTPANIQVEVETANNPTLHFHINRNNALVEQKKELPKMIREVNVTAQGSGLALFRVNYQYNLMVTGPYPLFQLDPQVDRNSNKNHLQLSVCTGLPNLNLTKREASNLAIMEVELPSGFIADVDALPSLEVSEKVQRVETTNELTKIILYFNNITKNTEYCTTVSAFRTHEIANQKPAPVVLYDFYDSSKKARLFYKPRITTICDICNDCGNICNTTHTDPQIGEQKSSGHNLSYPLYLTVMSVITIFVRHLT